MVSSGDYTQTLPRKRMAACALITDGADRMLLVEPTYKDYWEIPGGAVEADESPLTAATRELREELGLPLVPGRLLVVDWVPPLPGRTEGVIFVYSCGSLPPDLEYGIRLPAEELKSWSWCDEAEANERLSERLARRIGAARRAQREGVTFYLEDGFVV